MARTLRGLRKTPAPVQDKGADAKAMSPARRELARFQAERGVRHPPARQEIPSAEEQARLHEETAQRILAEAPGWAQKARIDPYNGQITHYIDLAGNATPPETERKGGFTLTGYPRAVPEAYMPPGALEPKPKPKPGSGPPTVADDLVNQIDLSRMRIVKDLKHDLEVDGGPAVEEPAAPALLGPSAKSTPSAKELAEKSLAAKLGSRGLDGEGAAHSDPGLDR